MYVNIGTINSLLDLPGGHLQLHSLQTVRGLSRKKTASTTCSAMNDLRTLRGQSLSASQFDQRVEESGPEGKPSSEGGDRDDIVLKTV